MVKRRNPNLLCKLGLHKWKHYGESVVITWKHPAAFGRRHPTGKGFAQKSRVRLTKRKCLRCGIGIKRRLVKNPDGTLSCIGWEPLSQSEYEEDEEPENKMPGRRMLR